LGELRLAQLESEVVVDDYKKKLEASGLGTPGRNRRLSKLRQMLNWAKDWKFITRVPFSRNLVSLDTDQEVGRDRRLEPGEEGILLKAADAEMKLRIVAALDTGMRKGEKLRVQLKHVDFKRGFVTLPRRVLIKDVYRQNTKNDKTRKVPITPRLLKLLKKRRFIGADGYVFGDAKGNFVEDIKKPWNSVNLVAHGHKIEWTAGANLSEKSWADLRAINLHWHDLRHEALSRLVSQVGDSLTISRNTGEDLVGGFVPDKGPGSLIADRQVLTNRRLERPRAAMRAAFDLLLRERREPPLHEVEPGRAGGGEVHVKPRMPSEPAPHLGRFVRAVVVHDQMDVELPLPPCGRSCRESAGILGCGVGDETLQ
jgi:integrase